jgi:hypothetical protein
MKGLLLSLLVLSPAAFASAPNCNRLQEIAVQYEMNLKKKIITPACSEETLPDLAINDIILKEEVIGRMKCASLGVMEERAKTLENQLTLLGGFQILKNEIRDNREATAQNNLTKAQRAAKDFRKALVTAQSLELLLDTAGATPILRELKNIPESRRNSRAKLLQEIRSLCSNRQGRENSAQDACSTQFSPDEESVTEINALINQGTLNDQELTNWSNALKIQRTGGDSWSFREMYSELREAIPKIADGRLTLNRNELNAIKNLPDFQDVAALPFMNALRSAKSGMAVHTSLEKFKFTALDLKERLQVETRSKISWLWKEIKDSGITIAPEKMTMCESALRDFGSAKECWEALSAAKDTIPTSGSAKKEHLTYMTNGMTSTLAYLNSFDELSRCLNPESGATALSLANTGDQLSNCSSLNMLNADLEKIQNELLIINGLREKIGSQNQRDMKFRNFAIEKIATMNCATQETSVVSCEESPMNVAPEAMSLTSDIMGLSIVHVAPSEATNLEADCENVTANGGLESDLCQFYESAPATPNVTDRPAPPTADSPYIEVQNARDPSHEAFVDGLAGIGWGVVNQLQNRPQMYNPYQTYNPYPYNYNPYAGNGMLSPADQILFNARFYGGYGFYTPTLGAAPYTAFPVISPYVQAGSGNSSSYFTNFGTYK